jgi:hypothetical protein
MQQQFDWIPKKGESWVSKFCSKQNLSSKKTQKRPAKRNRENYEQDVKDYREKVEDIRSERKRGKVWHMDEAGLFDDNVVPKSYVPIGKDAQVNTPNGHARDTIIATVCENGEKLPLYYVGHMPKRYGTRTNPITGERYRIVTDKGISGLNNKLMDEWVTYFLAQPQVNADEDVLCFDNHRSHLTPKIMERLSNAGLRVVPFPKGAAADLSMLDNSLFRDFKRDFEKAWRAIEYEKKEKKRVAIDVWNVFPEERIKSYWKKCGFNEKPRRRRPNVAAVGVKSQQTSRKTMKRTVAGTCPISSFFNPIVKEILNENDIEKK